MRRVLVAAALVVAGLASGVGVVAALGGRVPTLVRGTDGPLTPLNTLLGRTDENGYLRISSGTPGMVDGPLTPLGILRTRTDENGYLRVSCADCGGGGGSAPGGSGTELQIRAGASTFGAVTGSSFVASTLALAPDNILAVQMGVPPNPSASSSTAGTLAAGTYYFKIVASDGFGTTTGSAEVSATIAAPDDGTGSVDLTWDLVPGATYRIYKGTAAGAEDQYQISLFPDQAAYTYVDDGASIIGTVPATNTALAVSTKSGDVTIGNYSFGHVENGHVITVGDALTTEYFLSDTRGPTVVIQNQAVSRLTAPATVYASIFATVWSPNITAVSYQEAWTIFGTSNTIRSKTTIPDANSNLFIAGGRNGIHDGGNNNTNTVNYLAVFGLSNEGGHPSLNHDLTNVVIVGQNNGGSQIHSNVTLLGSNLEPGFTGDTGDNQTVLGDGANPIWIYSSGNPLYDGTSNTLVAGTINATTIFGDGSNYQIKWDTDALGVFANDGTTYADLRAANFIMSNSSIRGDKTDGHAWTLEAWDVDGAVSKAFLTCTNGNTPTCALATPSGGSLTGDFSTLKIAGVNAATIAQTPLTGTTGSIGGSLLAAAGSCATGTATVTGAVVGKPVYASTSDGSAVSGLVSVYASVTSTDTVTVQVCAVAAVTPTAKTWNVAVGR